jgi:predicted alpha/beta hydrolase
MVPTATVNGTTLASDDTGPRNGVALVFSHSLFFNRSMFRHQVERFSADYRVVVYDNRGQGESMPAPQELLDMDTLTEDAAALIEHLDLAPCHVLGNSMGGSSPCAWPHGGPNCCARRPPWARLPRRNTSSPSSAPWSSTCSDTPPRTSSTR